MGQDPANTLPTDRHTTWWDPIAHRAWSMWALILVVLAIRIVWQLFSPYTLIEDEAHYWEWSRHLDWSYYSKGPGIAWIIWISTSLLGHTEFAIRLPAAISGALIAFACARTTLVVFNDQRTAFISAILALAIPGYAAASLLMTIDAPYIACWAWASHFAIVAMIKDRSRCWLGFGACVALGFLFKYTILLLLPGVALAWWMTRTTRSAQHAKFFVLGLAITTLGIIPVAIWNAQHDWATVRHLMGHLALPGGDIKPVSSGQEQWTMMWQLEYIGLQLLIGGPMLVLGVIAWLKSRHSNKTIRRAIRMCTVIALPLLVFYLLVSLKAQTEGNWAMAAFVTLIPPGAWIIARGIEQRSLCIKFLWGIAVFSFIGVMILFAAGPKIAQMRIIGPLIPIERMTGMREHADDANRVLEKIRASTGTEPFVITNHYGRASLLSFYMPNRPTVHCSSAHIGGRKTQYDIWSQTNIAEPATLVDLRGRPALLIGGPTAHWESAFESIQPLAPLNAEPKENGTAYIGIGFVGFDVTGE